MSSSIEVQIPDTAIDLASASPVATILTEDAVIDAVRDYLLARSWRIVTRATAMQHGEDLVAERGEARLVIEAKGAGSSKAGTARYGKTFNSGQVFDHVAKAVLKAMRVVSAGRCHAAIALPDAATHRTEVAKVSGVLTRVEITVFWVDEQHEVRVESPWQP